MDLFQFELIYSQFLEVKKNIIMEGNFTKLIYSDPFITMNGIFLRFPIYYYSIERSVNKNLICFQNNVSSNFLYIKQLCLLEETLLGHYKQHFQCNKESALLLREQLQQGNLKLYKEYKNEKSTFYQTAATPYLSPKIMIKISGIWENKYQVGLTYKFIEMVDLAS